MPRLVQAFLLFDSDATPGLTENHFEPGWWEQRKAIVATAHGRGTVFFTQMDAMVWALRRYLRGGCMARFNRERYLWRGLENTRPWREWQLLKSLWAEGLPVPRPIGARVKRSGLIYTGDLITERIEGSTPIRELMEKGLMTRNDWLRIGALLRRFHAQGVRHDDINVSNVLRDESGKFHLIDFDKAWISPAGPWQTHNLARFRRSIDKLGRKYPACFLPPGSWEALLEGYGVDDVMAGALRALLKKGERTAWSRISLL